MEKNNFLVESHDTLKELTSEFDSNIGSTLCRIETLRNIKIELGQIAEDVENTDPTDLTAIALQFRDIDHKILLLADLMRYTVDDLEETFEHTRLIKESYFDLIVKDEKL